MGLAVEPKVSFLRALRMVGGADLGVRQVGQPKNPCLMETDASLRSSMTGFLGFAPGDPLAPEGYLGAAGNG